MPTCASSGRTHKVNQNGPQIQKPMMMVLLMKVMRMWFSSAIPVDRFHSVSMQIADTNSSRQPQTIMKAVCENCTLQGWEPMPVKIEMSVYYRIDTHRDHHYWCQCPYKIPVACTCVKDQPRARRGRRANAW
ncbi:hypothetical protein CRUP_035259 [Coryphaenoides rupestris]|nr:hypothetical protein CRUP_035259 [Coryphaenoides rupestris]